MERQKEIISAQIDEVEAEGERELREGAERLDDERPEQDNSTMQEETDDAKGTELLEGAMGKTEVEADMSSKASQHVGVEQETVKVDVNMEIHDETAKENGDDGEEAVVEAGEDSVLY